MGIRSERRGAGELTETSETMMFKTAATLEEWRREIKATLQFIVSCDLMNQQAKTAVQTPTEDDESDDDTPRRPYIRS
ncbi:hypothetical protein DIPPA_35738 [Diplonema papillatum]|nr:hypothetical protein DIPPA_35738 [Diplonema papillatum]